MVYLVHVDDKNPWIRYDEKYVIFKDITDAVNYAKSKGWVDPFNMGVNPKLGMANTYMRGDITILIMALEER